MWPIFLKELNTFFSSLIGYIVIAVFLVLLGLIMFVFPDTSLLSYNYATLEQLFGIAPMVFSFLLPAITMRSFAEENQTGTIELLVTRPISDTSIVLGKFMAAVMLVIFALIPTLLYYYTVYNLGSPAGNIDSGAVAGSYVGLILLAGTFGSIGLFASSLTNNQIVSFLVAVMLCIFLYWGFYYFSKLPSFVGRIDDMIQMIGIDYHYESISRGVIDSRDVIYFFSLMGLFLGATVVSLGRRKW